MKKKYILFSEYPILKKMAKLYNVNTDVLFKYAIEKFIVEIMENSLSSLKEFEKYLKEIKNEKQ